MQLEQTLRTLCALPAVSGFEMQAAKAVAELFRPYCDTVDADKNGNVIGSLSCGKEGAKTVLLDAHLDQIGFLVTEVLDGGFLRFAPVGGVDPRMLLGSFAACSCSIASRMAATPARSSRHLLQS